MYECDNAYSTYRYVKGGGGDGVQFTGSTIAERRSDDSSVGYTYSCEQGCDYSIGCILCQDGMTFSIKL